MNMTDTFPALASTRTITVSPPTVPQWKVWNFVTETPEGSALWNALLRWRRHYAEAQLPPPKPKRPRKTGKKAKNSSYTVRPVGYFKMKHSYPACLEQLEVALGNSFICKNYANEIIAIAEELGVANEHEGVLALINLRRGIQLSLPLSA